MTFNSSLVLLSILILSICGCAQSFQSVSAIEFNEKISQNKNAQIIDVRTPEEFGKGHINNSTNFNIGGSDFNKNIMTLDKNIPVFVYCLSGSRSRSAASQLQAQGFKTIYNLQGGIMSWRSENLPEAAVSDVPKGMTLQQFENLKVKENKMVLIDFYAEWCAPCKKMKPYLEEISTSMSENVEVIRIDADTNPELMKQLKITGLPVLQLYKNGEMTWSHNGWIEKSAVLEVLK